MNTPLAQTPLHAWHIAHGGRMVDFAGWSMPVQYASIVDEHQATRKSAGLFDISHMGRLRFDGPQSRDFLEHLLTRRVDNMRPGQIRYSLLTNEAGGILDDVLLYSLLDSQSQEYWILVVNASNRLKAIEWIAPKLARAAGVTMTDLTTAWAMIAVQGPQAIATLRPLIEAPLSNWSLADMRYYTGVESRLTTSASASRAVIVSRTGYTGEDGCELILESAAAEGVWQALIAAGAQACGLGCRDTLRLEAAMPLYGHELNEAITPWQAGLAFAVDIENRTFPGREALAATQNAEGIPLRVGIALSGKRVPREGFSVLNSQGDGVGEITSGTFSPTLNRPIAMAYLEQAAAGIGAPVQVDIRGRLEPGEVVKLPFYRRAK